MMRDDIPNHIIEGVANRLEAVVGLKSNTSAHALMMISEHVD